MAIDSINPATGCLLASFDELTPDQVTAKVALAADAFRHWRKTSFAERAVILHRLSDILLVERDRWARLMVEEIGKTRKQALAEAEKCAATCRYYADHGERLLADEPAPSGTDGFIRYLPLGAVLAVMPWNFPFWQVFRFLAPALMAGNCALLKHASNVPRCALAIEEIAHRAELPDGVFQTLLIGSRKVADAIRDPRIVAVTLTGSEGAGAQVAREAGQALKKCVLELGGNDPFIVMPSADLKTAVRVAVQARMGNNGQSCVSAKRFIIHRDVYEAFEGAFVGAVSRLKVGDPMEDDTELGPLATPDGVETLARQVSASVYAGARVLTGGARIDRPGNYFLPTVLADIPPDAPAYREEVFGPVAMLFRADSFEHAVSLANDTPFGLGSSVWTNEPGEQDRAINEIEAGQTFINAMVASDPRLPFGGIKLSGYGRELGVFGIREFTNVKTVVPTVSTTNSQS